VQKDGQARNLIREDVVDPTRWKKLIKIGSRWWMGECFFWYRPKGHKTIVVVVHACNQPKRTSLKIRTKYQNYQPEILVKTLFDVDPTELAA